MSAGEVRDDASPALARIRRDLRAAHDRLLDRLQRIISSPETAPFLQEPIITMREGRYVIPLKADFKGRIRGIVHDRSASGATLFIEPLSVVELGNTWRELQAAEEQEIRRILADLSARVAARGAEIEETVDALAELDLAFAKARYADALDAAEPTMTDGKPDRDGARLRLLRARHPLLDPATVVPIDVILDGGTHVLVITGPNTGGKTVTLKTVGLLALMAQSGLHIPADENSSLPVFAAVYADIGDEQSIEQSLSTFSAHLTNILSFIHRADEHSLVLLDELGAGTDPAEGSALARALLETFRQRGAVTLVATHYPELKAYAQLTPGVCNACVEFDPETLRPTYHLTIGIPGRSNALAIARRLGLDEEIVRRAEALLSPQERQTEHLLADLHRLRLEAARARDEAYAARAEAQRLTEELRRRSGPHRRGAGGHPGGGPPGGAGGTGTVAGGGTRAARAAAPAGTGAPGAGSARRIPRSDRYRGRGGTGRTGRRSDGGPPPAGAPAPHWPPPARRHRLGEVPARPRPVAGPGR
jgi:DNA mismatch repair protein MutS2